MSSCFQFSENFALDFYFGNMIIFSTEFAIFTLKPDNVTFAPFICVKPGPFH